MRKPNLLLMVPVSWAGLWTSHLETGAIRALVHGRDPYAPQDIDYVLSFRPPQGVLQSLPRLKAAFCLGAGVDGFLSSGDYPAYIPLVRFVDRSLSAEMTQYVLLHVLMIHRHQRLFDAAQPERRWAQMILPRRTEDTHIGLLGMGEIGAFAAASLRRLGFAVSGWSRTRKDIEGIGSFAGEAELAEFLGQADIVVCLLSLTRKTKGILNAKTFAAMRKGSTIVNVARGGHLIEADLIEALDSGHLAGAVLDVFEKEPLPETSPIWTHPKITVTPHIAAISEPPVAARWVLEGIAAFERGERPANIVDIEQAY